MGRIAAAHRCCHDDGLGLDSPASFKLESVLVVAVSRFSVWEQSRFGRKHGVINTATIQALPPSGSEMSWSSGTPQTMATGSIPVATVAGTMAPELRYPQPKLKKNQSLGFKASMISKRSSVAAKYTEARATTQPPVSRTSQTLLPKPWTPKSYITNPINPTAEKLSHAREPLSIRKRIPKWSDFRTTSQCPSETAMRNGGLPWNREVLDKSQTPEKATSASCLASPVYSFFLHFCRKGLMGLIQLVVFTSC